MSQPDLRLAARHYRIYPPKSPLGQADEDLVVDPKRTAILAIDVFGTDGVVPLPGYLAALPSEAKREIAERRIGPALEAARAVGISVVYVTSSAPRVEAGQSAFGTIQSRLGVDIEKDFQEPENDPSEYVVGPASVINFSERLAPRRQDHYIRKLTYSGFFSTRLDRLLRNLGVDTVVLLGFTAETSMFCTALDAMYIGYRVIWIRDATLAIGRTPVESEQRTNRLGLWAETDIGFTASAGDFITSCTRAGTLAGTRE
jgi:nicotinamidase-related amidase